MSIDTDLPASVRNPDGESGAAVDEQLNALLLLKLINAEGGGGMPRGKVSPGDGPQRTFGETDTNGDNTISNDERMDLDGDGKVTLAEKKEFADTNDDGVVDLDELLAAFDKDGDGVINHAEMDAFLDEGDSEDEDPS